jgi:protein TonB
VLPRQSQITLLVAPHPPSAPPPLQAAAPVKLAEVARTGIVSGQLRTPNKIPQRIEMVKEDSSPPPIASTLGVIGGVPGGLPGGVAGGVIGGVIGTPTTVPKAAAPKVAAQPVRVFAGILEGSLINQVAPVYPAIAKKAHIQGAVILEAEINERGIIDNLRAVSGHPMLVQSAIEAVKQWRYKPYYVSGEPVPVKTTITVTFKTKDL